MMLNATMKKWPPLYFSRLLKNGFFCHPERSEGSRIYKMNRFFVLLRITNYQFWEFFNSLLATDYRAVLAWGP